MPAPLQFSTRDASRVEETWKQFVPSATVESVDPAQFRFSWFSAGSSWFTLVQYDLHARVHSIVEPEGQLLACRVVGPGARVTTTRGDVHPGDPWLTDGERVEARWDAARVTALVFDLQPAQDLARRMCGNDQLSLRVHSSAPDRPSARRHWSRTFDFLLATLQEEHTDELILTGLARQALWLVLTEFQTTFRTALELDPQTRAAPATVRRALDFIDENAHRPITIDDVATAVHISTRGLQYAFRRALGSTPAEQLRRARLDGARRELLDGTADTIAAVARRWGFAHPSRFAAAYREAYGVLPSAIGERRRSR